MLLVLQMTTKVNLTEPMQPPALTTPLDCDRLGRLLRGEPEPEAVDLALLMTSSARNGSTASGRPRDTL